MQKTLIVAFYRSILLVSFIHLLYRYHHIVGPMANSQGAYSIIFFIINITHIFLLLLCLSTLASHFMLPGNQTGEWICETYLKRWLCPLGFQGFRSL